MEWMERIGANRVVLALSTARLGDAVGNSILFVVIPLYVAKLPAPWLPFPETVRAGILISLFGLANAASQPAVGFLTDRIDRYKPFILSGLLVMAASTLGYIFAGRFVDLLVLRAIQGVGLALTLPASLALLTANSNQGNRGGAMGVYATSRMIGFTAGPMLGGILYDHLGFDSAFFAAAALILVAMALIQVWIHDQTPHTTAKQRGRVAFFDRRLLNGAVLGSALAVFAMASAFSMVTPLEKQFNQRLDEGAFAFGIAFSVMVVSRMLFQVPLGRWSDHIGRKPLIIGGLILMAPATILMGEVHTTLQLIGLRIVQGIGSAGVAAPAFALAGDAAHDGSTGRQLSMTTMGFGLGIASGPLIAGVLAIPSFKLPFIAVGLILLASAWIIHRHVPETVNENNDQADSGHAATEAGTTGAAEPATTESPQRAAVHRQSEPSDRKI